MARIAIITTFLIILIGSFVGLGRFKAEQSIAAAPLTQPVVLKSSQPPVTGENPAGTGLVHPATNDLQAARSRKVGNPSFLSPHAKPITVHGDAVYVVNTPSDTVDVIDRKSGKVTARIRVGIDPVSVAVRPDGKELWVSNHISDSVSVIDLDSAAPTFRQVIATVQDIDRRKKSTRFDEPVAIAFASNEKAYVALSSENRIAVVNVQTRRVEKQLDITAQDPRDIVVRGERLYVIPFESNNRTQLSGGNEIDGDLVTFNAWEHSIRVNNVLSIGHVTDIVKNPKVPDRDLYVFDTKTDKLVKTVDTLGTLLYGLTVDSKGRVYIAQTDARNAVNGRSGTKKHSLKELENRAFLNQITAVDFRGDEPEKPRFIDLEPLPPEQPEPDHALATPFAIQVSDDDRTLYVSAAGSNRMFTVDAASGKVLGRLEVDAVPRGIALDSDGKQAWVFNAVANTVSRVDVSDVRQPRLEATISLEDPTHETFKRGRIAFNNARASSTGTFSCASCHPDGHTDQLLWVLKTPVVTGGNQIMPRSTMPLRGLRDTAPFHWDGIPGDPYGGNNSANIYTRVKPNADVERPESTTRHLIDGGLASTMFLEGDKTKNDEGKDGYLTARERDDMAKFLLHVTYPPAQRRAYDNQLSRRARKGFELFHIIGDAGGTPGGNLCGNCHRMPFYVSTNTPGTGMDAPTWRGAYDRFLILPQGRLNIIDFPFYAAVAERGIPERSVWQFSWGGRRAFDPVWEMVLEGSTGYSGSLGRQLTLDRGTVKDEILMDMLQALEVSAAEEAIVLEADAVLLAGAESQPVSLQFDGKQYVGEGQAFSHEELVAQAAAGKLLVTLTARHGENDDIEHPQPGLWTLSPIHAQSGRQDFPVVHGERLVMELNAIHVRKDANLIVDGRRVDGQLAFKQGNRVEVSLASLPEPGIHFLQIQNRDGLFSNDFIFHAAENANKATELRNRLNPRLVRRRLANAVKRGDLKTTRRLIEEGAEINARREEGGMTPLAVAAFHGRLEVARFLVSKGAEVNRANNDGNTPLLLAAFMCREEMCKFLLSKGASQTQRNSRRETPLDVVSGAWSEQLAGFYEGIIRREGMDLKIADLKIGREKTKKMLEGYRDGEKE
ncbi:MAG: ankyrin repeat domain-containing protein [Planctomycetota bacterium]|nr:ankyrin repeat domain-containing protein [Planctomycetota bacterium]